MNKLFSLSVALLSAAPVFSATILYSNFGPPANPYQAGGWVVNNRFQVALGFSPSVALPLLEIEVPVFWTAPQVTIPANKPLLVELVGPYPTSQQTPGVPPTVIESWSIDAAGNAAVTTVHHLASTLQPVLDPQQRYFVQMSSAGLSEAFQWAWNTNSTGATGFATGVSGTWSAGTLTSPALEVLGGPAAQSSVPEPASSGMIGAGLILAAAVIKRRAAAPFAESADLRRP